MKLTREEAAQLRNLMKKAKAAEPDVRLPKSALARVKECLLSKHRVVLVLGTRNKVTVWDFDSYHAKQAHGSKLGKKMLTPTTKEA